MTRGHSYSAYPTLEPGSSRTFLFLFLSGQSLLDIMFYHSVQVMTSVDHAPGPVLFWRGRETEPVAEVRGWGVGRKSDRR